MAMRVDFNEYVTHESSSHNANSKVFAIPLLQGKAASDSETQDRFSGFDPKWTGSCRVNYVYQPGLTLLSTWESKKGAG